MLTKSIDIMEKQLSENEILEPNANANRATALIGNIFSLNNNTPTKLSDAISQLAALSEELRLILGQEIIQTVNKFSGDEIGDLNQKREAAKSVNDLLDGLGLRIKCPKTGQGAVLVGVPRGDSGGNGRFEILASGIGSGRTYFPKLPKLELILKDMQIRRRPGITLS
jgi:hypothetical protein